MPTKAFIILIFVVTSIRQWIVPRFLVASPNNYCCCLPPSPSQPLRVIHQGPCPNWEEPIPKRRHCNADGPVVPVAPPWPQPPSSMVTMFPIIRLQARMAMSSALRGTMPCQPLMGKPNHEGTMGRGGMPTKSLRGDCMGPGVLVWLGGWCNGVMIPKPMVGEMNEAMVLHKKAGQMSRIADR